MKVKIDADYLAKLLRSCRRCQGTGMVFKDSFVGYVTCGICKSGKDILIDAGYKPKTITKNGRRTLNKEILKCG